MLTMENVTALRMRRHCLTRRAGAAEYDALYRDLSPGLNVHWHGFGQPPCLVERADFDDVEYNGRRQRQRILVKGRFQNGNIGFVEAAQMELFAGLYRRPYKPTEHSELLRELIGREGPLNIEAMKRMTGLLVKQITPALHRLQEAFLVFEDQFDGEWDRGWYLFDEMFPDVDPARISRTEALLRVLPRLAHRQVYLTAADAEGFYGLPQGTLPRRWKSWRGRASWSAGGRAICPRRMCRFCRRRPLSRCAACWRCTGTTRWSAVGKAHERSATKARKRAAR